MPPSSLPSAAVPGPMRLVAMQFAVLFMVGCGWGSVYSIARFAVSSGIPPLGYALLTLICGSILTFLIAAARGRLPRLNRRHLRFNLLTGMLRGAAPAAILYITLGHLPAGLMVMLMATGAMMTYAMALAVRRERFQWTSFAGLLCGLGGVALIALPRTSLPDPAAVHWVAIGLGAPFFYALSNMVIDRFRPADGDSAALVSGQLVMAALYMLPVAALTGSLYWPGRDLTLADGAILLNAMIDAGAFVGIYELIRAAGPVFAGQTNYVTTMAGVFWGMLLLGERHSGWVWAALVLILGGLALVNARRRP